MPLEDILRKIDELSAEESRKIIAEAEERCKKILESARAQASAQHEQILAEARSKAEATLSSASSAAETFKRQSVLAEKQALIDSAFSEALRYLQEMPPQEYGEMLTQAILRNAEGHETLVLGEDDEKKLGPAFISSVNEALAAGGKEGSLTVKYAPGSLGGGFILEKGGVSLNLTFPALIAGLRDEMDVEIAHLLFEKA